MVKSKKKNTKALTWWEKLSQAEQDKVKAKRVHTRKARAAAKKEEARKNVLRENLAKARAAKAAKAKKAKKADTTATQSTRKPRAKGKPKEVIRGKTANGDDKIGTHILATKLYTQGLNKRTRTLDVTNGDVQFMVTRECGEKRDGQGHRPAITTGGISSAKSLALTTLLKNGVITAEERTTLGRRSPFVQVITCKDADTRIKAAVKAIRADQARKAVAKEMHIAKLASGNMVSNAPLTPAAGQSVDELIAVEMRKIKASLGNASLMQLAECEAACAVVQQLTRGRIRENVQEGTAIEAEFVS